MLIYTCTREGFDEDDGDPIVNLKWIMELPTDFMIDHCVTIFFAIEWEEDVYSNYGKLQPIFWFDEDLPPDEQIEAADKDDDYFMIVWEEDE